MWNEAIDFMADTAILFGIFAGILIAAIPLAWAIGIIRLHTQKEGTATLWEMFGRYVCTTMQYRRRNFNGNGFIVDGGGQDITGSCWLMFRIPGTGYIFYANGFVKPVPYSNFNDDDGFGKENYVFLHELPRNISLTKAETTSENGAKAIPVDIKAVYRQRPVNPELFAYTGPRDVSARVDEVMESGLKDAIGATTPDKVKAWRTNSADLWNAICAQNKSAIDDARNHWGVEIIPARVLIKDIGFQPEDQSAQAQVQRQAWEAKGAAAELVGSMLEIEAVALGMPDADTVRAHLRTSNPTRLKEIVDLANKTLIERKLGGGYKRFDVPGLQELATALLKKLSP